MTSEQTEILQRFADAAAAYVVVCDELVHAFEEEIVLSAEVGTSGQGVAVVATSVAALEND